MNNVSGEGGEVHWVVGNLSRDESEVLGVWARTASARPDWRPALVELQNRGVERIRFALHSDLAGFREDLRARFPGATALPSFAQLLDRSVAQVAARHRLPVAERLRAIIVTESGVEARAALAAFETSRWGARYPVLVADWRLALEQGWALWSLAPALRREVLAGDGKAAALNRSLRKAVDRHGAFDDAGAAARLVQAVLPRELRRLEQVGVAAGAEHNYHRECFGSRIAAVGS
ncbi:transposase [Rubrivivax sp. RP6-9]|uniref:transposase n=1 Tax=Rubrivivax sp. RP6-9 TaxID=3415750 RepID=UPI003CC5B7A3